MDYATDGRGELSALEVVVLRVLGEAVESQPMRIAAIAQKAGLPTGVIARGVAMLVSREVLWNVAGQGFAVVRPQVPSD